MPELTALNFALYLAVCAWANWGGSHMKPEHWAQYPLYIAGGIKQAVYILWPDSPHQLEDLRRLKVDAGFESLVLRFGWERFKALPEPAAFIAIFRAEVLHAKAQGYRRLAVMFANEPNLELVEFDEEGRIKRTVMTPDQFLAWYREVVRLWRADPALGTIPIVAPAVGAYAPNDWQWWDEALRDCAALSDFGNAHLYPSKEAELAGPWSLDWWRGQMPGKRLYLTEMGCRSGTPAATRNALLPKLWRQVKACAEVEFAAAFAQWTEGREHEQHWLTSAQIAQYLAIAQEAPGTTPPTTPPAPPTEEPAPPIDLAGRYRVTLDVTVERLS